MKKKTQKKQSVNSKFLHVKYDEELKQKLKILAHEEDLNVAQLVRRLLKKATAHIEV